MSRTSRSRRSTSMAPRKRPASGRAAREPGSSAAAHLLGLRRLRHEFRQHDAAARARAGRSCASSTTRRGGPTEARDIADAIFAMAAACRRPGFRQWGFYHFAGPEHELVWLRPGDLRAARPRTAARRRSPVGDYPTPARRPPNSTLDCRRIRRDFRHRAAGLAGSLARVIDRVSRRSAQ